MKIVILVLKLQNPVCPLGVSRRAYLMSAAQVLALYLLPVPEVSSVPEHLKITFLIQAAMVASFMFPTCVH